MKNKDQYYIHEFIHIPPYMDCREPKTSVSWDGKRYQIKKGPSEDDPSTNFGGQGNELPQDKETIT